MTIMEELRSGKVSIYAQWLAVLALIFMFLLPFKYVFSFGMLFVWSIASWIMAVLILLIEFPYFSNLLPADSRTAQFADWTRNHVFRSASYFAFSAILWFSFLFSFSWLIIPAALLDFSALFYALALWRQEAITESVLKGGDAETTTATTATITATTTNV